MLEPYTNSLYMFDASTNKLIEHGVIGVCYALLIAALIITVRVLLKWVEARDEYVRGQVSFLQEQLKSERSKSEQLTKDSISSTNSKIRSEVA